MSLDTETINPLGQPESLPWPTPGLVPIREGGTWSQIALLMHRFPDGTEWQLYAQSFRDLADLGVASITENAPNAFPDSLVYAIAFSYRHHIELMMKAVTILCLCHVREAGAIPQKHALDELWDYLRPRLEKCLNGYSDLADFDTIGDQLKAFAAWDANGQGFRYPYLSRGGSTLAGLGSVDLGNLRDVVHGMSAFFMGALGILSQWAEWQTEMEADWTP